MAYCAATDIVDYGNFPATDSAPAILTALCTRAQAIIDGYCGRTFEETSSDGTARYFSFDEDVDDDGVTLWLDRDLYSITSILVGTDTVASTNYTTIPRTDKPFYGIRLKDNSTNSWDVYTSDGDWENAITVTGKWAYSTSAPADIVHAAVRLAYYLYKQRETDADLDRPLLTNDGVTIMPTRLPADVMQMLNRYKRMPVA